VKRGAVTKRGFILAEVILVLVVSSLVTVALLAGLVALIRGLQPQRIRLQGEELPIAPTFGAFPSAVRLHQTLTDRVAAARAVYVFGGRHISIPTDAPPAQLQPLKIQALPKLEDLSPGLPTDARSFYDLYAPSLGEMETASSADDFTMAIIGPRNDALAVTCLVQVRRSDRSISDGVDTTPFVVREVRLWDADEGALRYVFAEKPAVSAKVFVGAVHTWMRYQINAVGEEGPTCVVFPDPWLYGGARGMADDIPPFSRFSYFVAVSP
jgi:hypothetical protein